MIAATPERVAADARLFDAMLAAHDRVRHALCAAMLALIEAANGRPARLAARQACASAASLMLCMLDAEAQALAGAGVHPGDGFASRDLEWGAGQLQHLVHECRDAAPCTLRRLIEHLSLLHAELLVTLHEKEREGFAPMADRLGPAARVRLCERYLALAAGREAA